MPSTPIRQSSRASLVLLVCLLAPACGISLQRATAVAVEQTSIGLKELRDHVEAEHQASRLSDDEYNEWKRRLGRIARVGKALTTALINGDGQDAATQVSALIDLLDTLAKDRIKKLPPNIQISVRIAFESIRAALLVISALTGAALPPADTEPI